MANGFKVGVSSIATDGTNIYLNISIFDGAHTSPAINIAFPVGTPRSTITAYLANIVNSAPVLDPDIATLSGYGIAG